MKLNRILLLFVMTCFIAFYSGCKKDDVVDPGSNVSLAGTYDLVSMHDKVEQIDYVAGEPQTSDLMTMTVTGDIVFTDKNYTMNLYLKFEMDTYSDTETMSDHGTYQITNDNTLNCHSEDENQDFTMNFLVEGANLTLEDEDAKMVWKKR